MALFDLLELRVNHHHSGEVRGQSLEGVVDRVNQGQLHERGRVHASCHDSEPSRRQTRSTLVKSPMDVHPPVGLGSRNMMIVANTAKQ